jgi:hypothetical protein
MRVFVCGGRTFDDWELLASVLDGLEPMQASVIIHGRRLAPTRRAVAGPNRAGTSRGLPGRPGKARPHCRADSKCPDTGRRRAGSRGRFRRTRDRERGQAGASRCWKCPLAAAARRFERPCYGRPFFTPPPSTPCPRVSGRTERSSPLCPSCARRLRLGPHGRRGEACTTVRRDGQSANAEFTDKNNNEINGAPIS